MRVEPDWLRKLIFEMNDGRRFTQDSPILPEVWLKGGVEYCRAKDARVDLLLTPHKRQTAGVLAREVLERLTASTKEKDAEDLQPRPQSPDSVVRVLTRRTWTVSVNQSSVAVALTLKELITCVLPLTEWWMRNIEGFAHADTRAAPQDTKTDDGNVNDRKQARTGFDEKRQREERRWMGRVVGVLARCAEIKTAGDHAIFLELVEAGNTAVFDGFVAEAKRIQRVVTSPKTRPVPTVPIATNDEPQSALPCLWSVGLNREGTVAIDRSVPATKGDAATRLFNITCQDLAWAIVDSGIDADHGAFQGAPDPLKAADGPTTRVVAAYDFTRLRQLLSLDSHPSTGPNAMLGNVDLEEADRQYKRMRERLRLGQSLDWAAIEPLIDISPRRKDGAYRAPRHDHGTHVAGILGARKANGTNYEGMCPDIKLYDLRVLNDQGQGDEFSIIAALQFIRYLNARGDQPVIHGVNLSLSLIHEVENFACGRTPVCDECERLVASGVVVVAAAGNRGYERVLTAAGGELEAYRSTSITDPGNAEAVITVGATHRFQPHTYGVSYFSSRGPTGDGRIKPDVLGPGERIYSTLPRDDYGAKDGTSMAAPHVSGVAALLMARHREFVGQPARVKKIICDTATDLGRERYFQGSGMVDALRALQTP